MCFPSNQYFDNSEIMNNKYISEVFCFKTKNCSHPFNEYKSQVVQYSSLEFVCFLSAFKNNNIII